MSPTLVCHDEQRRQLVRQAGLNGLDYLEVDDTQLKLTVFFLGKAPQDLADKSSDELKKHVRVEGGRRVRGIRVVGVEIHRHAKDPERDDCMIVTVDKYGDFSTYTLKLVEQCLDDQGRRGLRPYPGFDPRYAVLEFSFKAGCPSELDCQPTTICPPKPRDEPEISYLAKDYASFRQLLLDRLALTVPDWKERHEADVGITLVELLAYVGDYLSYHQDAVATEAYLGTARQRISVRRHAQLVDYQLHEGCNARAWVFVELGGTDQLKLDPSDFYLTTSFPNAPELGAPLGVDDLSGVPICDYLVFEPMAGEAHESSNSAGESRKIRLVAAHNCIHLYTWGDARCCLPAGATSASLADAWTGPAAQSAAPTAQKSHASHCHPGDEHLPPCETPDPRPRALNLKPGDVILFEEVLGPETGNPADADPAHRHVVRLTRVEQRIDEVCGRPVLEIEWAESDALPFSLCVSTLGPAPRCRLLENVSVARGNMLLVDHGRTIRDEPLGSVPVQQHVVGCEGQNRPSDVSTVPARFRAALQYRPLTYRQPLRPGAAAGEVVDQNPRDALPCVWLRSTPTTSGGLPLCSPADVDDPAQLIASLRRRDTLSAESLFGMLSIGVRQRLAKQQENDPVAVQDSEQIAVELVRLSSDWTARNALLDSQAADPHFVVEIDNQGQSQLRFGDGELGRRPAAGSQFKARYRVGNGPAGNVGADTIRHLVFRDQVDSGVTLTPRNPLAAAGGVAAESLEEAKQFAPHAFRQQLRRAIKADDYAAILQRDFGRWIQSAKGTLRWTGSGYEVLVAVDLFDRFRDSGHQRELLDRFQEHLHAYRRIGHDIAIEPARQVPLEIELLVCVHHDYVPGEVKDALLTVFSNRINPNGTRGFFHADNLSFGDGIALSGLVAAAQSIPGVENVVVKRMHRKFEGPNGEVESGLLPLGPLEIARLDNDQNFPENGTIKFDVRGGR